MKTFFKLALASLLGALLGSFLTLFSWNQNSAFISAPIISPVATTPTLGLWEKIAAKLSSGSVGIQVFQTDRLMRQGSGLIISSDGLIVAPADLITPNAIYQVFYDDKIYKGTVVSKNFNLNLFLLKTEALYSNVAELDISADYKSGQEILMLGKIFDLSQPTLFSQKGIISYVTENKIIIDSALNNSLLGTGAADSGGKLIGLVYLRSGKLNLIKSEVIDSFFREYLNKNNK